MTKKTKTKVFSFQGFDAAHYRTTEQYAQVVDYLFTNATIEIAHAAANGKYNPDKPFKFSDYPYLHAQMTKVLGNLVSNVKTTITQGSTKQWLHACDKNDAFISHILDTTKLSKAKLKKYQDRNLDALETFQGRKVNGMDLSQRVWKYTKQFKQQLELGLDVGLGEGRSAQQLSKDLRENLVDDKKLFRRVRDKRGNLQLSKAAKAFNPGQGVYRSSYKNAMRLTRSEINMAYRESDWMRWQQLDFVVGFEIHRSNHEPQFKCKLCDNLTGRYPKSFKFKGWHPQCRCVATPILMDYQDFRDDRVERIRAAIKDKEYKKLEAKNEVKDVPDNFKDFVANNLENQKNWASTPYFIKDNFVEGMLAKGLKFETAIEGITPKITTLITTPSAQIADNIPIEQQNAKDIESALGITRGEEMNHDEANELKGNVNYSKGGGYRINCQSCVVANELRRRGYDVTAVENTREKDSIPYQLSRKTEMAWLNKETKEMPKKLIAGGFKEYDKLGRAKSKTIKELTSELAQIIKEEGRYHIDFGWKGTRSGHIICLEKLSNGKVRIYDPQNGRLVSWADLSRQINLQIGVRVLRVDNLMVNTEIINGIVVKL